MFTDRTYFAQQFQGKSQVFNYHILYSASNLIADIGGYLGLFLGLSCFGLVEMLEKLLDSGTGDASSGSDGDSPKKRKNGEEYQLTSVCE